MDNERTGFILTRHDAVSLAVRMELVHCKSAGGKANECNGKIKV